MNLDGILNVNKPADRTSFSIISWLRRLTGEKRIGHTGTLDPFASGVLPVCLGQATKISSFLSDTDKTYTGRIELGISTDTFDKDGRVLEQRDYSAISLKQVREALVSFEGIIDQVPPAYSALKYRGRKYYELARAGIELKPAARQVNIIKIELINFHAPFLDFELECSKGTYVRSLANELGNKLGCGAYLKSLTRTRCGIFKIEESLSPADIEKAFRSSAWENVLKPLDFPIREWRKVILDNLQVTSITNGIPIKLPEVVLDTKELVRAYTEEDKLLALLKFEPETDLWRSKRVFIWDIS